MVKQDETVANIETDKVTIPVNAPEGGLLLKQFVQSGDTVEVGSDLFSLDPDAIVETAKEEKKSEVNGSKGQIMVEAESFINKAPAVKSNSPAGKPVSLFVEDEDKVSRKAPSPSAITASKPVAVKPSVNYKQPEQQQFKRGEHREDMTRMRLRIAERMKEAQNTAASLTTFNEIDMSALTTLRTTHKDSFVAKHGVKLGFMSPFVLATARCLGEIPRLNARIDGRQIVYHEHVDISVAVATPVGLVTPVLRNCQQLTLAQIEAEIARLGELARTGTLSLEELSNGTFTISNGGVFGSLMGTPILNSPQSAILGMHAVKERAVVVAGQLAVRPMMYVALTYDHRIVDGREAATFLVRLKQLIEDPQRLLLDLYEGNRQHHQHCRETNNR